MPYDYDAQSILKRLMDGLQSDVNRLQGGFAWITCRPWPRSLPVTGQ